MRKEMNGLKLGQRIKYMKKVTEKGEVTREKRGGLRVQKGKVAGLYEHIFLVEWDNHRYKECFSYSMLESTKTERIEAI